MHTSFDEFPKKTERECFDFKTKYFATSTRLQLDSRHSLIYWWCCWILGKGSSNYGKFTRILPKIFYPGLELVGDEKHPPFECCVTSLKWLPLITFVDFRDPPNQCLHFRSKFERSPLCRDPSKVFSDLPFWELSYDWSLFLFPKISSDPPAPQKNNPPPPQEINNDRPVGTSEIIFWHLNMAFLKRADSWYAVTLKVIHLRSHRQ